MSDDLSQRYRRGEIVVVQFPSSSPNGISKKRPAVVIAVLDYRSGYDYLCALITSQKTTDPTQIKISESDVQEGALRIQSYIRPLYLYMADRKFISGTIGRLSPAILDRTVHTIIEYINRT